MNLSKRLSNSILASITFVLLLWCIKSAEILFSLDLHMFAVYPHSRAGVLGIITAPLVHGSLEHIFSNSLPLLVLLTALLYGYPRSRIRVLVSVWLMSGLGVWLFARDAYHLGASGITHGIFFYLLVVGILRRDKSSVAIMMIAFFMYGGMTMSIFPREPGISFEYHLFGGINGALVALVWFRMDPKPQIKTYPWEHQSSEIDDPIIGDAWRIDNAQAGSDEHSASLGASSESLPEEAQAPRPNSSSVDVRFKD
ncbi:rhomboid family intramembrane serine protease [Paraglaciecola polaris]|uniref:Rhomboid family protein n=1 Tax=Paraglaciecola polaris LMG 21857 TaxID=1129793 RepID=K6Z746_9ALTE|nr:rhomboid family intramembrane serine protease [Paraglaciecola polaris]GAC32021.1 rhomboid family protein [Paraglaciecola polaris LMG 21857]